MSLMTSQVTQESLTLKWWLFPGTAVPICGPLNQSAIGERVCYYRHASLSSAEIFPASFPIDLYRNEFEPARYVVLFITGSTLNCAGVLIMIALYTTRSQPERTSNHNLYCS